MSDFTLATPTEAIPSSVPNSAMSNVGERARPCWLQAEEPTRRLGWPSTQELRVRIEDCPLCTSSAERRRHARRPVATVGRTAPAVER